MRGRVWNAVKSVGSAMVSASAKVNQVCSKTWGAVTGLNTFNKAEIKYREITQRYEDALEHYKSEVNRRTERIEDQISCINTSKIRLYDTHFPRFVALGRQLHRIEIKGVYFEEYLADDVLGIKSQTGVRNKQDLFTIDFNNLSFKQVALSVLTLGFSSRKKARESLQQVLDEEKRIDNEIARMDAQLKKIAQVEESLANVVEYFDDLMAQYSKLLKRLEFGINTQRITKGVLSIDGRLDFRHMPIMHIEEFLALFNLSIVLKTMATLGYLSSEGELVDAELSQVDELVERSKELLAA